MMAAMMKQCYNAINLMCGNSMKWLEILLLAVEKKKCILFENVKAVARDTDILQVIRSYCFERFVVTKQQRSLVYESKRLQHLQGGLPSK